MSDRREKIAKALHELDVHLREADGDFGVKTAPWDETDDDTRTMFREYADVALAAIDAEPTEAGYYAGVVDDVIEALMFSQHIEREALEEVKTFLISARNARQGGER